jgi:hypothetical protein
VLNLSKVKGLGFIQENMKQSSTITTGHTTDTSALQALLNVTSSGNFITEKKSGLCFQRMFLTINSKGSDQESNLTAS